MFKTNQKQLRPPSPMRSTILDKITLQTSKFNRYTDSDKKFREKYADIHFKSIYDISSPFSSHSFTNIEHTQDKIKRLKQQRDAYKSKEKSYHQDDPLELKRKIQQQVQNRKKDRKDLETKLEDFALKILKHCNQMLDKNLHEMINLIQTSKKKHQQHDKEDIQAICSIIGEKQKEQFKGKFITYQNQIKQLSNTINNHQTKLKEIDIDLKSVHEQIKNVQETIQQQKTKQAPISRNIIQETVNQLIIKRIQQQRLNKIDSLQTLLAEHIHKLQQKIIQQQRQIQTRIEQWQSKIQIEIQQISKDDQLENFKLTLLKLHPIVTEVYTAQQQLKEEIKQILDKISIQSNKLTLTVVQLNEYKQKTLQSLKDFKHSITNRVQITEKSLNLNSTNLNKTLIQLTARDKQYDNKFEKILEQFIKIQSDMKELKGNESLTLSKSYRPEYGQNSHFDFDKLMGLKVSKQSFVYGEESLKENSREIHPKSNITNQAINQQQYENYLGIPTLKKGSTQIIEQYAQNKLELATNTQNTVNQSKIKQVDNFQLTQPPELKNLPEQNEFHLEDLANHARQFLSQIQLENILMTSSSMVQDSNVIEQESSVEM